MNHPFNGLYSTDHAVFLIVSDDEKILCVKRCFVNILNVGIVFQIFFTSVLHVRSR